MKAESPPPTPAKAPTERAQSTVGNDAGGNPLSPGRELPPTSVAGSRVAPKGASHIGGTELGSEPILGGANASVHPLSPVSQQRSSLGPNRAQSKAGSRVPSHLGKTPTQLSKVLSAAGNALGQGRAQSKAGSVVSISPSDSPSQAPSKRAREAQKLGDDNAGSDLGTERVPSMIGRSQKPLTILSEDGGYGGDARKSAVGSVAASQRSEAAPHKTHSQAPISVISSHVPSVDASKMFHGQPMSPTHSHANRSRDMRSSSQRYTPTKDKTKYTRGDITPTQSQSRAHSPDPDELDDRETEIVQNLISSRAPGTRTSMAPSTFTSELKHSHFHDQDLCILLHAAEDDMVHDVVKKAVLKAAKARVKSLGMKHDTGVSVIFSFPDCGVER